MICPRCKNDVEELFGYLNGNYYCRKCITFKTNKLIQTKAKPINNVTYNLSFDLSLSQKDISNCLVDNFLHHKNSYVWAVCGSGKTEIVYEVIKQALNQSKRVCFAIPRRELVKELYSRIDEDFKNIEIGVLYGGCTINTESPFIICTTHQLYKFESIGFDLIIVDEVDAFPYRGNVVLNEIFKTCCKGNFIQLSATFTKDDIVDGEMLVMNRRYHGYQLPIPKNLWCPDILSMYLLVVILKKSTKQWIIYTGSIVQMKQVQAFLNKHIKVEGISSKTTNNQEVINKLKSKQIKAIVSTTILERGITIEDVQVLVFNAKHTNFDERTLIQIAGRVGRKPNYPTGLVLFVSSSISDAMRSCIKTIKYLNSIDA